MYINKSGIATNPDPTSADQFSEKLSEGMIRGGNLLDYEASVCPITSLSRCSHHLKHVRIPSPSSLFYTANILAGKVYCIIQIDDAHTAFTSLYLLIRFGKICGESSALLLT